MRQLLTTIPLMFLLLRETLAIVAGDFLAFNVDSVATVTRVVISIPATKTRSNN